MSCPPPGTLREPHRHAPAVRIGLSGDRRLEVTARRRGAPPRHRTVAAAAAHLSCARPLLLAATCALALALRPAAEASAQTYDNLFFLHHSTGRNLIQEGHARPFFDDYNAMHGTSYAFWDHDYNDIGLCDPSGVLVGHGYGIPGDNTDPDGLHTLWTTANGARDSIMTCHQVLAFKSCFPASAIESDAMLAQYQTWYVEMRDQFFALHPEKLFVVMSTPPLHRLSTQVAAADRARTFAGWLASTDYLAGHPNVVCFDLFDALAHPDDGSAVRNMLRYEYELSHAAGDSHPNQLANETVGPLFWQFLVAVTGGTTGAGEAGPPPANVVLARVHPNPFGPATTIRFTTSGPGRVTLRVFDVAGRAVRTLLAGRAPAGSHRLQWDGRDDGGRRLPGGVYLLRLDTDEMRQQHKIVLVR